jgi:hypothetical protein
MLERAVGEPLDAGVRSEVLDMTITCPGCGLEMPRREMLTEHGYYNATPECWSVYTEVLGAEYSNAVVFGQIHQRTVDSYAVQHAGGAHPDKSVDIHLAGLYLVIDRGCASPLVPRQLQRLASSVLEWPHFSPPERRADRTIFDVALAGSPQEHAEVVRQWSAEVWKTWSDHHTAVSELVGRHLGLA